MPKSAAKFLTALVGAVAEAVTLGLLHGTAAKIAGIVIAAATAAGVYVVPNTAPGKASPVTTSPAEKPTVT